MGCCSSSPGIEDASVIDERTKVANGWISLESGKNTDVLAEDRNDQILVLGTRGSGKSSLIELLQYYAQPSLQQAGHETLYKIIPYCAPTHKVTPCPVVIGSQSVVLIDTPGDYRSVSRVQLLTSRASRIIITVDSTDEANAHLTAELLANLMHLPAADTVPILIVYTKRDDNPSQVIDTQEMDDILCVYDYTNVQVVESSLGKEDISNITNFILGR